MLVYHPHGYFKGSPALTLTSQKLHGEALAKVLEIPFVLEPPGITSCQVSPHMTCSNSVTFQQASYPLTWVTLKPTTT